MFIASYKQFAPKGRTIASRLIAITIATSFLAVLLPIAVASATNTMACCLGKTEGHCESGIAAEKLPEPEPEPMCGLTNLHTADDEITIVAKPAANQSHHAAERTSSSQPAAETNSVGRPCEMDCCACAVASSRRQKRDDSSAEFIARLLSPSTTASQFESVSLSFSSNEDWKQTSPRGPPTSLL